MESILWIVVGLIFFKMTAELILNGLNRQYVLAHKETIPAAYVGMIDEERYKKSVSYTLAKSSLVRGEFYYDTAFLAIFLLSGILPWLYEGLTGLLGTGRWGQAGVFIAMTVIMGLPSLPVEWTMQFKIEEAFGFNKSTLKLWITDKIKGLILTFLIGVPIVWVILWFLETFPQTWWIWAATAMFVFQVLFLILYPKLILPLFNKLSPMEEGELKERLLNLADKAGFHAKTIEVIDGSKRSGHSNAYFTGFGKFRRIVLFDTLIAQMEPEELEAVLAHEIGHYKCGHIPQRLLLSFIMGFAMFGVVAFFLKQPWFYEAFGFDPASGAVPVLVLLSLLGGLVTFWTTPFMNEWSRKHEYEADAFAKKALGTEKPMISSLQKLHKENLANLTPHPWFSVFYYSHPTLMERQEALEK